MKLNEEIKGKIREILSEKNDGSYNWLNNDWYDKIQKEIKDSYEDKIKENRETLKLIDSNLLEFYQLIFLRNQKFLLTISEYFDNFEEKKHPINKGTFTYNVLYDLKFIFNHLINNSIAIKRLITNGLNSQATMIFRSSIELFELAIAIVGDENFYKQYKSKIDRVNSTAFNEFKTPKFETIKIVVNKIIKNEIIRVNKINYPKEIWREFEKFRNNSYSEYSKLSHWNYQYLVTGFFSSSLDSEDEGLDITTGGKIDKRTVSLLSQIIFYHIIAFQILIILIVMKHKMPFKNFGKSGEELGILLKLSHDLFFEHYDIFLSKSN